MRLESKMSVPGQLCLLGRLLLHLKYLRQFVGSGSSSPSCVQPCPRTRPGQIHLLTTGPKHHQHMGSQKHCALRPASYILHSIFTLHPKLHLHPSPCSTTYTLHPTPCNLRSCSDHCYNAQCCATLVGRLLAVYPAIMKVKQ